MEAVPVSERVSTYPCLLAGMITHVVLKGLSANKCWEEARKAAF